MTARQFHLFSPGDRVVLHAGPQAYEVLEVTNNLVRVSREGWGHWGSCTLLEDCDWYLMNGKTEKMSGPFPTKEDAEACIFIQPLQEQKVWTAFSASGQYQ